MSKTVPYRMSADATTRPDRPMPSQPKVHPWNPKIQASVDAKLPCDQHAACKRQARQILEAWISSEYQAEYNLAGLEFCEDQHGTYWRVGVFSRWEQESLGFATLPYSLLGFPTLHRNRF